MFTVELTKDKIKGLLICAGKNDVRQYLNGVCFDFAAGMAVATDGLRILVHRFAEPNPEGKQIIVQREFLEHAARACGKGQHVVLEAKFDVFPAGYAKLTVHTKDGPAAVAIEAVAIDAQYPQYQRALPGEITGEMALYNPDLLAGIQKAMNLLSDGKTEAVAHVAHNGLSGAIVYDPAVQDTFAVLMPMRSHAKASDAFALELVDSVMRPKPAKEQQTA